LEKKVKLSYISCLGVLSLLAGCAIEGVGWQGHVDAYNNAAADGREYVSLHRETRDATWYAGWCSAIRPHFARMGDVRDRVDHYCAAMQAQPESAGAIWMDLVTTLDAGTSSATASRDSAYTAVGASAQLQQAKQVHCTTTQFGNATNTDCR
jgi:hypothetical protein